MRYTLHSLLLFLFTNANIFCQDIDLNHFEDLSKKRLIAVGESAHGVQDFANWNINFFKALVHQGITTTFLIESDYSSSKQIDRYIKGESDDLNIDTLISNALYKVWRGKHMKDFIIWAKDYNSSKGEKTQITFLGFDSQWAYGAIEEITTYLHKNHPHYTNDISAKGLALLAQMGNANNYNLKRLPEEDKQMLASTIERINQFFKENVPPNHSINTDLMVLNHAWEFENANVLKFASIRDKNMAIMLDTIISKETKPVLMWAHNGHINKSKNALYKPVGHHLSNKYKNEYINIGLDFKTRGNSEWYKPIDHKDWLGKNINFEQYNIKVLKMKNFGKTIIREYGAGRGQMKIKNNDQFDYLVYFEEVK